MQQTPCAPPDPVRKRRRQWPWIILSYGIAAGCLYWVFHGIPLRGVVHSIAGTRWWWLAPAVVLDLLVYVCAGWEWQLLLRSVGRLSFLKSVQIMFAGRFANDVLPVHVGYIVRLYLASRWMGTTIPAVLPSLLIERLFDSFWLALGIGLTILFFPLPPDLLRTGEILGGIILFGAAAVVCITVFEGRSRSAAAYAFLPRWKVFEGVRGFIQTLAQGIRGISASYLLPSALALSVLKLAIQVLAFLAVMWAYGFAFTFWIKLAVFLIAYVGMSMPSTPASVGVFQLFCAVGLRFVGVPKPAASGFALLAFVVLTAPLSIAGFVALAQSGLSLHDIRSAAGRWRRTKDLNRS